VLVIITKFARLFIPMFYEGEFELFTKPSKSALLA